MSLIHLIFDRALRPVLALVALLIVAACGQPMVSGGQSIDPMKPVQVALMVPYGSGDVLNDQLADNLVNAAQMARRDLRGANIDLRVYQTAADADTARAEAERAIAEGAQVIVGPLFSGATAAVSEVARRGGVNVISFSNNAAVAGGRVFVLGLTFDNLASRLVSYAASNGRRNVAIVQQQGVEGDVGRTAAENAILVSGSRVATIATYPLNIQAMSEQAPQIASELRASGADAVFFTDSPLQGLGIITAALGSEEYLTGVNAQFMGLTRWDASTDILQQPNMQGGWFAAPDPELTAQFDARYLETYGAEPHNLAAIAYDAVAAVGAMVASAAASGDADPFRLDRMTDPSGFAGAMGVFRFLPNGQNERALAVMQVHEGATSVVSPAPRGFMFAGF